MGFLMRSRLLWRRSATAVGIYSSAVLGFLGTVVAARNFSTHDLGLYTLVLASSSFLGSLLDLTVEEAVIKYGFRYEARHDWGRLRRLFRSTLFVKLTGNLLAAGALLGLSLAAGHVFGDSRIAGPLAIAAALPVAQSLEGLAGVALILHSRYDVRAAFLVVSMSLRLVGIAVGSRYGLTEAILGIVAAQVVATSAIGVAGIIALRRFPDAPRTRLGTDAREIFRFVFQSSIASSVVSFRTTLVPILLGIATTPTQVGFFKVAQSPQQGFASLSAPARIILLTEQTRAWERGRRDVVFASVRRFTLMAAGLMVVAAPILWWLMPDLVRVLFKPRNLGATNAARVILLAGALQFATGWTKSFPTSIGRPNLRVWTHALETAVLLPLVIALGSVYGATGAAVAVLVSTAVFVVCWLLLLAKIRREPVDLEALRDVVPDLAQETVEPVPS